MSNKKTTQQDLNILFIGNSHTYCNDLPQLVKRCAEEAGRRCRVTMLAHPNWYLSQHAEEPEARFNILYGNYDYVILQEHAHPLPSEEEFEKAAQTLNWFIREAGSTPVIFECWAKKDEPELREPMNKIHRRVAKEINALLAPAGENWHSRPNGELYAEDGAHASPAGSGFAAQIIWEIILEDLHRKESI